jgi:hypothetical protein
LIFAIVALIPITYLFINRGVINHEVPRPQWVEVLIAVTWGVVYALLLGVILGPLGLLAGLGVGVYAFFR